MACGDLDDLSQASLFATLGSPFCRIIVPRTRRQLALVNNNFWYINTFNIMKAHTHSWFHHLQNHNNPFFAGSQYVFNHWRNSKLSNGRPLTSLLTSIFCKETPIIYMYKKELLKRACYKSTTISQHPNNIILFLLFYCGSRHLKVFSH